MSVFKKIQENPKLESYLGAKKATISEATVEKPATARAVKEVPLEDLVQVPEVLDLQIQDCKGCGAQVTVGSESAVAECLFCGRKTSSARTSAGIESSHKCLIPFSISLTEAEATMHGHLQSLLLRPIGIARRLSKERIRKVYVPFWAYDTQVTTDWYGTASIFESADIFDKLMGSHGNYERRPIKGHRSHLYDDWLSCASRGISPAVVRQLEPFSTSRAKPMNLAAGDQTPREVEKIGAQLAWTKAQVQIRKREYKECLKDAMSHGGVETAANVSMEGAVKCGEPRGKLALLPLYIFSTWTLFGRAQIVINGETGKAGSHVPYSWFKLITLLLFVTAGTVGACFVTAGGAAPLLLAAIVYLLVKEYRKAKRDEATFLDS